MCGFANDDIINKLLMETEQSDNKLIADFVGLKRQYESTEQIFIDNLKYDTSWDWLMPVVEKIWDLDINTIDLGANFTQSNPKTNIFRLPLMVPIDMAYEAVVEFIKYWNSQAEYKR